MLVVLYRRVNPFYLPRPLNHIFKPTLHSPLRSLRVDRWHLLLALITYINKIVTIWVNWSLLAMCGLTVPPYTPGVNEVRHTNMAPTYLPKPIFTYLDIQYDKCIFIVRYTCQCKRWVAISSLLFLTLHWYTSF